VLVQPTPCIEELCPNCGEWATSLVDDTGWCISCSPGLSQCSTCGGFYKEGAHHSKCWKCRKEEYLYRNADAIERYIQKGHSFTQALELVANDNRPVCKNCYSEIRGGKHNALFCGACKTEARHYRELRKTGLTPDVALDIATSRVEPLFLVSR
jgi:hypothetical protein